MREVLATPGATRYILEKYGIRARKKYGQNFLIDANVIRGIIDAAQTSRSTRACGRCWRRRWKTAIMSKYCGRIF